MRIKTRKIGHGNSCDIFMIRYDKYEFCNCALIGQSIKLKHNLTSELNLLNVCGVYFSFLPGEMKIIIITYKSMMGGQQNNNVLTG